MRRTWIGMHCLGFGLLVLVGCAATESHGVKPPLREEYNLPPAEDGRFSTPIAYPKETLNNPIKREQSVPGAGFKGPGRGGVGTNMGGGY